MDDQELYTDFENRFDRLVYQNDKFFWLLAILVVALQVAIGTGMIPADSGWFIVVIILIYVMSWIYTNARRRGCGIVKSFLFVVPSWLHPVIGGIVYFLLRPRELVVTSLSPSRMMNWPVFEGLATVLMSVPFRFMMKMALWMMGLAFLTIGVMDAFGRLPD